MEDQNQEVSGGMQVNGQPMPTPTPPADSAGNTGDGGKKSPWKVIVPIVLVVVVVALIVWLAV